MAETPPVLTELPWNYGFGETGDMWYQDADGFWQPVAGTKAEGAVPALVAGVPTWSAGAAGGHWEPVTNGDPENPEVVFANGDVVMYFVVDA